MPVLQSMKTDALTKKKPIPYIFEYYNVFGYYANPLSQTRGVMARMFQALAEGLNSTMRLPKFILVIPDINFTRSTLRHNYGMTIIFEDCIIYFAKQLECYIHTRQEDLKSKRLGAVSFKTRLIWLKMIDRPAIPNHPDENRQKCLSGRGKFNKCLDQLVGTCSGHHIMSIQSLTEPNHFNSFGQLSHVGTIEYWWAFNGIFKRFDHHEISLKPPLNSDREKLPTPPAANKHKKHRKDARQSKSLSDQDHYKNRY